MLLLDRSFFVVHTLIFLTTVGILTVFLGLYYLLKRFQIFHPKNPKIQQVWTPLLILTLGLLSTSYIGFFFWHHQPQILTIAFNFLMLVGLAYNIWYSYLFVLPFLISWYTVANINHVGGWWNGIFTLILVTHWLTTAIFRILKWQQWWQVGLAKLINFGLDLWIIFLIMKQSGIGWFGMVLFLNTLTFFLVWFLFRHFQRICDHLERLNKNIVYDDDALLNQKYAHPFIYEIIRTTRVQIGLTILFNFQNLEVVSTTLGNAATIHIKRAIMRSLREQLQSGKNETKQGQPLFYRTDYGEYACFLPLLEPLHQPNLAPLYALNNTQSPAKHYENLVAMGGQIQKILQSLQTIPDHVQYGGKDVPLRVNTALSIYGVHSCSLTELEEQCRSNLLNLSNLGKNQVYINNPRYTNFAIYPPKMYRQLKQLLPLEDLFLQIVPLPGTTTQYVAKTNCLLKGMLNWSEIQTQGEKIGIGELTERFLASTTLTKFREEILTALPKNQQEHVTICLNYPLSFLASSQFSPLLLKNRVENLGCQMSQITWCFCQTMEELCPTAIQNIQTLRKMGSKVHWYKKNPDQ